MSSDITNITSQPDVPFLLLLVFRHFRKLAEFGVRIVNILAHILGSPFCVCVCIRWGGDQKRLLSQKKVKHLQDVRQCKYSIQGCELATLLVHLVVLDNTF